MASKGRGRLSSIDLLPEEAAPIVAWAAQELASRERTQLDIYAEFRTQLIALQGEQGLAFDIPAFSSFNRYSLRLAGLTQRLQRSRAIAEAVAERTDGESADNLTKMINLTMKTLVFEMLESGGEAGFSPKDAMQMANAIKSIVAAENLSTLRRQKIEAEYAAKAEETIEKVAAEAGLSAERVAQLRHDFLGVRPKPTAGGDSA